MSLGDAQIGRLFKIRRTALRMVRDRGYTVEDAELENEEAELLVNITDHALVPEHRVLNQEEKKALLAKYGIKEAHLPRLV